MNDPEPYKKNRIQAAMITQNFDMDDYLKKNNDGTNFSITYFGDYMTRDLIPYFSDPAAWREFDMMKIIFDLGITNIQIFNRLRIVDSDNLPIGSVQGIEEEAYSAIATLDSKSSYNEW